MPVKGSVPYTEVRESFLLSISLCAFFRVSQISLCNSSLTPAGRLKINALEPYLDLGNCQARHIFLGIYYLKLGAHFLKTPVADTKAAFIASTT